MGGDAVTEARALAARLRELLDEARRRHPAAWGDPDEAARFVDEEGEEAELSAEFVTATMGHVLAGQGRRDEARKVFRAVLAAHPDDAEAQRGLRALDEEQPA